MKSKWLVIALVISIALNVAALGIGIGFATGKPYWGRGIDPTAGLGPLIRSLPGRPSDRAGSRRDTRPVRRRTQTAYRRDDS